MALEEKTYLVCNYLTSRVVVSLRDTSVIIEGGSYENPTKFPFTLSELQHINNTSDVFKTGELVPEDKEFVYSQLKITNWKDIMTNEEIEKAIVSPTYELMSRIVSITNTKYFERIYGIFIGLRNANAPITNNITNIISIRYKELLNGIRETKIILKKPETAAIPVESNEELTQVKKQLEEMKAMMSTQAATVEKSEPRAPKKAPPKKAAAKTKKE